MVGELAAIGSAATWAVSSIMFAATVRQMEPLLVNVLRTAAASLFLATVIAAAAVFGSLGQLSVPAGLSLAGTSVLTMSLGDTLYIGSLALIGVARGVPIATTLYPVLTFILAALFLDEKVSWAIALGTALVVGGISLVARPASQREEPRSTRGPAVAKGVALALAAGAVWAIGTIWMRTVVEDDSISPLTATAVRVPAATLVLLLYALGARGAAGLTLRPYSRPLLALPVLSGVLGTGIGSLLYVVGVQEAGAGKAAVLASTAPLFALPLAAILLAERPTAKVVVGTVLAVTGIFLVV